MASREDPVSEPERAAPPPEATVLEPEKAVSQPEALATEPKKEAPPPETKATQHAPPPDYLVVADVVLRVVLFVAAVTSVVVIVTGNQTKLVPLPVPPFLTVPRPAKFSHSPAFM